VNNDAIARVLAALYLTLRGTPVMYYGEELAMENNDPKSRDEVQDPIGRLGWPEEKGRDGERTPMQWDATANAGFSKARPWLPVPASARTRNVATESADPSSLLSLYRRLNALRASHEALREGEYVPLAEGDPNVLAYLRRTKDAAVLVALNMSASSQTLRAPLAGRAGRAALADQSALAAEGPPAVAGRVLIGTSRAADSALALDSIALEPFEVVIADVGAR
jgi:alpha-glucosidase